MSENWETIFSAPANLKSNVLKSFGFYKKKGNIGNCIAIFKWCRTVIKSIKKLINRRVVLISLPFFAH